MNPIKIDRPAIKIALMFAAIVVLFEQLLCQHFFLPEDAIYIKTTIKKIIKIEQNFSFVRRKTI